MLQSVVVSRQKQKNQQHYQPNNHSVVEEISEIPPTIWAIGTTQPKLIIVLKWETNICDGLRM